MLQEVSSGIASDSVRRALASVFSQSVYHRPLRRSLWQYIVGLWNDMMRALFGAFSDVPWVKWALIGVALTAVAAIVARMVFLRWTQRAPPTVRHSPTAAPEGDPWFVARHHAAAGRYLDAVHALYLALLDSIAGTDTLSLDPAKTVGDYVRELRAASSARLPVFREFARAYEPVVWGSRSCDRECYDTLAAIAGRAVR